MNKLTIEENKAACSQMISLGWKDSSSIKQLLDVIANIIAQEYINVAQTNPYLFNIKGKKV
ncbi:MAG: hypothetical protein PHC29_06980 [Candidatus Omnitrophica bacterium]|nr:hypothetical protein [Candidatus Omnitrophota bacterium]